MQCCSITVEAGDIPSPSCDGQACLWVGSDVLGLAEVTLFILTAMEGHFARQNYFPNSFYYFWHIISFIL